MSETQVVQPTYVTTTESKEIEETSLDEKKVDGYEAEQASYNEPSDDDEEEHVQHQYDEGNSEAVSISSSKLQEFPSHSLKEKISVVRFSNNANNTSLSTREELLEKFGQCT